MKRLLVIFHLVLATGITQLALAQTQVTVTLTIPNLGSAYLSDYISHESNRVLMLTNTTGTARRIYLRGKVEQLNAPGYYLRTRENFKPSVPITLGPNETKTLLSRSSDWEFIESRHLEDNMPAPVKRSLLVTGILPDGEYLICVQAFDYDTDLPLSMDEPAGCLFFMVSLGTPPQLILPACGDTVDQQLPLISWTPAIILQSMPNLRYDLYIVELVGRGALNPAEVMEQSILYRGGNPFVVENLRQTFYQFLPGDPPLKPGSRYVLCVVVKDARGTHAFENFGRSEICIIDVREPSRVIPGIPAAGPVPIQLDPGNFQVHQISTLSGRLLYRFYEDVLSGSILSPGAAGIQMMQLQPGQSLQNIGFQPPSGGQQIFSNQPAGAQYNASDLAFAGSLAQQLSIFDLYGYNQPPPPQYILPAGYRTSGGRPLKQARVRFTARYAVGKKTQIQHPSDLEFISGLSGYQIRVTGGNLDEMYVVPANQWTKVLASTTTDDDGNYHVSFLADETFGVITTGPVQVQWGGGEFPMSSSGFGFFRVITMEVEEKWYCHPDIVIFLQPGQSLDVPDQVVVVQSYNVEVQVRAKETPYPQQAGSGGPVQDAVVKLGRAKYLLNQMPACFPFNEVRVEHYEGHVLGSPYTSWKLADSAMTGASGNVTFKRLVKHDGLGGCGNELYGNNWPSDSYRLEADSHPYIGSQNYCCGATSLAPCAARLAAGTMGCFANDCAPRSADYIPPLVVHKLEVVPQLPKIYARSVAIYEGFDEYLPNTNLVLLTFDKADQLISIKPYKTDEHGDFVKQFMWPTDINENMLRLESPGLITSKYIMDYWKSGFKRCYCHQCDGTVEALPENISCINYGINNKKVLKYGQLWRITTYVKPDSWVRGRVMDEHGQPIYGKIKIGDGPFKDLEMQLQLAQGVNAQFAGQPYEIPTAQIPQGGVQLQQGIQVQQNPSSPGTPGQIPSQPVGGIGTMFNQGGFQIEINAGAILSPNFEQVSVFSQQAQSGQQIPVIIIPDASNYFADTFYVNIPSGYSAPGFDLGTFVIKEKLRRPRITVVQESTQILGVDQYGNPQVGTVKIPVSGAEVKISNLPPKQTNSQGIAHFVFGSPSPEFRIRVNKSGFVPYDAYVPIPQSKEPYEIEILLDPGKIMTGTVSRAADGQPIAGARIYSEIGSNDYGAILIEAFSDAQGHYTLEGLPIGMQIIKAAKADETVTYVGQSKLVNTILTTHLDFELVEAPFLLSSIWNLPVDVESVAPSGSNWVINGAFVDLPHNARFKPEDEYLRLPFTNVTIKPSGVQGSGGKPIAEPVANHILSSTLKFRSVLNNANLVDMSGPGSSGGVQFIYNPYYMPVFTTQIRIEKGANNNGNVRTRAFSMLEYFRFTYQYDGQFYLGETPENAIISSYKGTANTAMPDIYYLMNYSGFPSLVSNPTFKIHNFDAFADRTESYVRQDSFKIATKLIVRLHDMNPNELIVSTGGVVILPDKIIINQGDQPLEFGLGEWHVKTNQWAFDPQKGGIVTNGNIKTDLIEFYTPSILIKPDEMRIPVLQNIGIANITLGGIVPMEVKPGAKLKFSYEPSAQQGTGHWRVILANSQENVNVGSVKGLPGWNNDVVAIRTIENFSGPPGAVENRLWLNLPPGQVVNHYNVIKQAISYIYLSADGVKFSGNTDIEIPNLSTGSTTDFVYSMHQGQIKLTVQGLYTVFETTGKVRFQGDDHPERILLLNNYFSVTGGLTIYDDNSPKDIKLRARLTKQIINNSPKIDIKIIDVDAGGQLEGTIKQTIVLGGGSNGVKRVLEGAQHVNGNTWDLLTYYAQMEGFGGNSFQDGKDKVWYKVTGAVMNDDSKEDKFELTNIDTPFGDFSMALIFDEMAFEGNLNITVPLSFGAVTVTSGTVQMRVGGLGFYLAGAVSAVYPVIADLNTNFIVGYYPQLNPGVKEILKKNMYIKKLPDFLEQTGIQGLYISANKPFFNDSWGPFYIGVGYIEVSAQAGVDARFWVNFGDAYGGAALGGLAYGKIEVSGFVIPCEVCAGLVAELGFEAEFQWQPTTYFSIAACGAIGLYMQVCGIGPDFSARLLLGWDSDGGFDVNVKLGETCSGNTFSSDASCN